MACESWGMSLDKATPSRRSIQYRVYCQAYKTGELASREQVRDGSKVVDKTRASFPRWKKESKERKAGWQCPRPLAVNLFFFLLGTIINHVLNIGDNLISFFADRIVSRILHEYVQLSF